MQTAKKAAIEFKLKWQSEVTSHQDDFFAGKIDFWRDIFPGNMADQIAALAAGECYRESFAAGELVAAYSNRQLVEFQRREFKPNRRFMVIEPRLGRFYPQGYAAQPLHSFKDNYQPFRLVNIAEDRLTADRNHPLARYPLTIEACLTEPLQSAVEHGGICYDIAEMISEKGPGMQAPEPGK